MKQHPLITLERLVVKAQAKMRMEYWMVFILLAAFFVLIIGAVEFTPHMTTSSGTDDGPVRQRWGYVDVRQGAHMFWWLHYTTHADGYQERPWIIWLQGGPGFAGSGIGNFQEIGPFHVNLEPRETTWVQEASVLFIDNPVGCGYSYVDEDNLIPRGTYKIALDLIKFLHVFFRQYPDFQSRPLYLFGQSFGGQMVSVLGVHLQKLIMDGEIQCQLRGVAIGNGFVSPMDFINGYGAYLFETGMIDENMLAQMEVFKNEVALAAGRHQWKEALERLEEMLGVPTEQIKSLDVYNILHLKSSSSGKQKSHKRAVAEGQPARFRPRYSIYDVDLWPLMNGEIRKFLHIIPDHVTWGAQNYSVYFAQQSDLLKPVYDHVDWLLQNSDVNIIVYEGQLDLMCQTAGAIAWIQRLQWEGLENYTTAKRYPLVDPDTGSVETFVKAYKTLKFYWNLGAGHTVPTDVPWPALRMLQRILSNVDQ